MLSTKTRKLKKINDLENIIIIYLVLAIIVQGGTKKNPSKFEYLLETSK